MIEHLAKLAVDHARELFEDKVPELVRALDLAPEDLESISTDVLITTLEGRTLDFNDRDRLRELADLFAEEDVIQALSELRAGNFSEAERLLERSLGPDGAHVARVGASTAAMLYRAHLPVFMK